MIKIIAEIGWNHMGDMNLAKKMIIAAAQSGADMCKFQTWSEKNLKSGAWDEDGRRDIYRKAQISGEDHLFLIKVCKEQSVRFLTSVFNVKDLEYLCRLGIDKDMIKIPSHEVYNLELIRASTDIFEKVLVSTGAAKWEEIKKITETINSDKLIFLHCVSAYPCPAEKINLPRLQKLKDLTKTFGYSGHYTGIDDAIAAICHGSTYVEKHFTIDKNLPGRDNKFSILPQQMKALADFRDNYEKMNINLGLELQECEMDIYENYRGRWSKDA